MRWLARWRRGLRALLRRADVEREVDEEMRFHLDMEAAELQRSGLAPAEARRRARIRFGGVDRFKEEARDARALTWVQDWAYDVRHAWRWLRRSPGFAAGALVTLALGIGANTAVFSAVSAVLLRPLPFEDAERLVLLWSARGGAAAERLPTSYPDYADLRDRAAAFAGVAAWSALGDYRLALTGAGEPVQVEYGLASDNLFAVLGVDAVVGRTFAAGDDEGVQGSVALISERLWRARFAADAAVIGGTIRLDGKAYTLAGVLPSSFHFGGAGRSPDVWLPLGQDPTGTGPRSRMYARGARYLGVAARLRDGITLELARQDAAAVSRVLAEENPSFRRDMSFDVVPLREQVVAERRATLLMLLGAVFFVVLIACANVANLLLARATARGREMSVRAALGASRSRLTRQLLAESTLLALLGGGAGLAVAWGGVHVLRGLDLGGAGVFVPYAVPAAEFGLDARVLGFAAALSLLCAALFGLAPALRAGRPDVAGGVGRAMRTLGTADAGRARRALIVGEVALSIALLAGAGLMIRSFERLLAADLGFRAEHILAADIGLPAAQYAGAEQTRLFHAGLLEQLAATPGVDAAGIVERLPLSGPYPSTDFRLDGRAPPAPGEEPRAAYTAASPGYFGVLGIRLVEGRLLLSTDDERAAPVAVVNETLARRYWPGESPIGQRLALSIEALRFRSDGPPVLDFESAYRTVVGVVADVRQAGPAEAVEPLAYLPIGQRPARDVTVVVRGAAGPDALAGAVRRAVREVDPLQPVAGVRTLDRVVQEAVGQPRYRTLLVSLFAGLALLLTAVGLYGVLSYHVAQRTGEIGLRVALGASRGQIARLVAGQGLRLAFAGLLLGLVLAVAGARLVAGFLFGVSPLDPVSLAAAAAVIAAVALLASWLPARRALRIDPTVALRHDQ